MRDDVIFNSAESHWRQKESEGLKIFRCFVKKREVFGV